MGKDGRKNGNFTFTQDKVYKEVMEERKYNFYEHCVYRQRKDLFGIFFLYVYMLLYLYIKLLDIIEPR